VSYQGRLGTGKAGRVTITERSRTIRLIPVDQESTQRTPWPHPTSVTVMLPGSCPGQDIKRPTEIFLARSLPHGMKVYPIPTSVPISIGVIQLHTQTGKSAPTVFPLHGGFRQHKNIRRSRGRRTRTGRPHLQERADASSEKASGSELTIAPEPPWPITGHPAVQE
jgi:hypothetical protein